MKVLWRSRSMEEYNRYMRIADGDPVKLARMLEIQSWFDNKDQLAATVKSMPNIGNRAKRWRYSRRESRGST